jgi:hypothetical protein
VVYRVRACLVLKFSTGWIDSACLPYSPELIPVKEKELILKVVELQKYLVGPKSGVVNDDGTLGTIIFRNSVSCFYRLRSTKCARGFLLPVGFTFPSDERSLKCQRKSNYFELDLM